MHQPKKNYRNKISLKSILEFRFYIISYLLWLLFLIYISTIPPISFISKITFFILIFSAIFSTIFIFINNIKNSLYISMYLVSMLLLLFLHQLNYINMILVTGLFVAIFIFNNKSTKVAT